MSRGDLSPYDLDLGSGRVHTHSQAARFLPTWSSGLRAELHSVFCLSFSAIYEYRNGSPGEIHHEALWYLFQVTMSADMVKTRSFRLRFRCAKGRLGLILYWFVSCYAQLHKPGAFLFLICAHCMESYLTNYMPYMPQDYTISCTISPYMYINRLNFGTHSGETWLINFTRWNMTLALQSMVIWMFKTRFLSLFYGPLLGSTGNCSVYSRQ